MQFLKKNVDSYVDQYLIPVEKIWQPSDFLPNSESDKFFEEVKNCEIKQGIHHMIFG
jgi:acyl-[acyl-carrier-protein] desaturase